MSLLFSRLENSTFLSLVSYEKDSHPLIIFMVICWTCCNTSMPLVLGRPEQDKAFQMCLTSQSRGEGTSSWAASGAFPTTAQEAVGVFFSQGHTLVPTRTSKAFSAKLLSRQVSTSACSCFYSEAELCISFCRTSQDTCRPISSVSQGPSEQQHNYTV